MFDSVKCVRNINLNSKYHDRMKTKKQIRVGSLWLFLGDDYMTNGQLEKIAEEKPTFTVICDRNNEFDRNAMLVKWGRRKIGYINAEDTRFLKPVMRNNKCHIQYLRLVVSQSEDIASAVLKCTVEVDLSQVEPLVPEVAWEKVRLSAPPVHYNGYVDELELAVYTLFEHLDGTAIKDDMTPDECVAEIERTCRFDMSQETTLMLNGLCYRLEMTGTDDAVRLLEMVEAASTRRRSRHNREAIREWIDEMMESDMANEQMRCYVNRRKLDLHTATLTDEQIAADLIDYEEELLSLPCDLGKLIDEPERLLHCTFYKNISREKQEELLSQLVLRNSLREYLYCCLDTEAEAEENDVEEDIDEPEPVVADVVVAEDDDPRKQLIDELSPIFRHSHQQARDFLAAAEGMKPCMITQLVARLLRERKVDEDLCHRPLWKILHDTGIYKPSESNWNKRI